MANLIMINPASGDSSAALLSGPDSSEPVLEKVPKGTIFKVVESIGNFYTVEYDNGMVNEAHGGTSNNGTVVAYPYAYMYDDKVKTNIIGKVTNGTACIINDDTPGTIIKISAFTTEGLQNGYVEAKYIYRDKEDSNEQYKLPRMVTLNNIDTKDNDTTTTGTVNSTNGVKCRTGPGSEYTYVGAFNNGAVLTIHETKSGWHRVSGSDGWGNMTDVWVSASYVRTDGSNSTASTSKSDATSVSTTTQPETNLTEEWQEYFSSYDSNNITSFANDEYYKQLSDNYLFALGAPPRYNMDIDIQYTDEITAGGGRVMNKTLMANPTILSICPGKVRMFPNGFGEKDDGISDALLSAATGNTSLVDKINKDDPSRFSGKMYAFEANTAEYALYVNALCRACAIMLGVGDRMMPNTSTKLKNFDYTYWTIRKKYSPEYVTSADNDTSIFRKFFGGLLKNASRVVSAATDDTMYLNFFMNGSESNISESVSTEVSDSPLSGVFNTISSVGSFLNYFTGSGFNLSDSDANEAISAVLGQGGDVVTGLANIASNFLAGGRVVLPKMVNGASYSKSISCNLRFFSPYGDKYSVFLRCIVPICHLVALAYPRQLSDNMYTFPFLVRCAQTGKFNVDLGIISSMNITRGGSDETSWTIDTVSTEWDVTLEITPLIDELMITGTNHPVLMVKNEMLLDYLANFCGFNMFANNFGTKADMLMSFVYNRMIDFPPSLENKLSDTLYSKINNIFRASWS